MPWSLWLLRFVPTEIIWWICIGVILFLAYRMAFAPEQNHGQSNQVTDRTRVKPGLLERGELLAIQRIVVRWTA